MTETPAAPTPAKKSSAPMIIAIIVVAILSLCCCIPGIINIVSPLPYTTSTSGIIGQSSGTGTIPATYGLICICAAIIPWLVLGIVALLRRPKKQ
ncbi:MAG: hypothetical protein ABSC61_01540 [Anaerolineales bacterium]